MTKAQLRSELLKRTVSSRWLIERGITVRRMRNVGAKPRWKWSDSGGWKIRWYIPAKGRWKQFLASSREVT